MGAHVFGEFELDAAARSLTLRGEPVPMQPLVFDLLLYLVRHAGRVVPKAELMDALWPDLHVTEASLQRLVSLARVALKPGGLDGAIRNVVRLGYRFALDQGRLGQAAAKALNGDDTALPARQAATDRRWAVACELFAEADRARRLGPENLDLWAYALECRGRMRECLPLHARAVEGYLAAGAPGAAALAAARLSRLHYEGGQPDAAWAWFTRAKALLGDGSSPATEAYILWVESRFAAGAGRPEEALGLVKRAVELAGEAGEVGLKALAIAYEGSYDISLGRIGTGRARQDEAAAMALSGEADPVVGGLIYCAILWTCRFSADWSRAGQWSPGFELWCQAAFAEVAGTSHLHRAEILGAHGHFAEALDVIENAVGKLGEDGPWAMGDAYRVRGDVRLMMGDVEAARADYAQAIAFGWDAQPGHAHLLAEEDVRSALASLDRLLASRSWIDLQRRGWLLANKAQIAAVAGLEDEARAALDELDRWGEQEPTPAIRAMAVEARAELAVRRGDLSEALRLLHLARQLWTSARHEYQAAWARLRLADVLELAGDHAGARVERAAAQAVAERIGAGRLLERMGRPEAA